MTLRKCDLILSSAAHPPWTTTACYVTMEATLIQNTSKREECNDLDMLQMDTFYVL